MDIKLFTLKRFQFEEFINFKVDFYRSFIVLVSSIVIPLQFVVQLTFLPGTCKTLNDLIYNDHNLIQLTGNYKQHHCFVYAINLTVKINF